MTQKTPISQEMLDLGLSSHNNHYLFSDYFLNKILKNPNTRWAAHWQRAVDAVQADDGLLAQLTARYEQHKEALADYQESQLEDHWFEPIFDLLGHAYEGQARVNTLQGTSTRFPDYVFFPDADTRRTAAENQDGGPDYFRAATAVGEVKAWDRPLGKKRRGGGNSFDDNNPSYQIDYYVRATGLTWGVLSNGRQWRLVHKDTSYKLDVYFEIDVVAMIKEQNVAAAAFFWLFFHRDSFVPGRDGRVFLDAALDASEQFTRQLEDDLRDNAYKALELLIQGFIEPPGNNLGADDLDRVYQNSLYLLYRIIFLFYGESRRLLPLENETYRPYSLTVLARKIAADLDSNPFHLKNSRTYWIKLQQLCAIINGTQPALNKEMGVPRYNGGLFNPQKHPFLEQHFVGDYYLVRAIDALARRDPLDGEQGVNRRDTVDYRTLGVRQIGSIYEGLLEYRPRIATEPMVAVSKGKVERWMPAAEQPKRAKSVDERPSGGVYLVTDKGERKATGSYYTPDYIVKYIVENTLGPVVERVRQSTAGDGFAAAVLRLRVLDPAMGSGHFLVEATDFLARAIATETAVRAKEEAVRDDDLVVWRRQVVERCIYGVDKNSMAVELAKLSLWLVTVARDKPLSFLDHHLRHGDSLVGAWLDDLKAPPGEKAAAPAEGQRPLFNETAFTQSAGLAVGGMGKITAMMSDDIDNIHAKEQILRDVREAHLADWRRLADVWTSHYFGNAMTPAEYRAVANRLQGRTGEMGAQQAEQFLAHERVRANDFFHWELEFPEVFFDEQGRPLKEAAGFDAVIGNPPYIFITSIPLEYRQYFFATYETCDYRFDLYGLFVELGLNAVTEKGYFGYIIPHSLLNNNSFKTLREKVIKDSKYVQIVDFTKSVFEGATNEPMLLITQVSQEEEVVDFEGALISPDKLVEVEAYLDNYTASLVERLPGKPYLVRDARWLSTFLDRNQQKRFKDEILATQGLRTGSNEDFITKSPTNDNHRKILAGSDIHRYGHYWPGTYVLYDRGSLDAPRNDLFWSVGERILVQEIRNVHLAQRIVACFDDKGFIGLNTTNALVSRPDSLYSLRFMMAVLSSKLINKYFRTCFIDNHIATQYIESIPLANISFTTAQENRTAVLDTAKTHYESGDTAAVLALVEAELAADRTDTVHDILAHLAQQMIRLNEAKQTAVADFWLDLQGAAEPDEYDKLRHKGKWEQSLHKHVKAARRFVDADSRSTVNLDESLGWNKDAYIGFVKQLAGRVKSLSSLVHAYCAHAETVRELNGRLSTTDQLIDQIVYRLYGLTDDEIAIVENA